MEKSLPIVYNPAMEKESIKLEYPFAVGNKKKAEYAKNGVILTKRGTKGFTRLEPPFDLTVADFATLSEDDLYRIESHLQDTPYQEMVDMAKRVQVLRKQAQTIHGDGFAYPTDEKPFTWSLHSELPKEIANQIEELKSLGINEVKVGLEMEFSCPETPVIGFDKWEIVKSKTIWQLKEKATLLNDPQEKIILESKIQDISEFNAREMMMFDLIELNPVTKDILEPLFGLSRDGDGYYDARGVLELKVRPTDPVSSIENRQVVLKALYDTATNYGLEITLPPSFHVNVSLWGKDGNIFDDKSKSFDRDAKLVTEGVTKAFYDAVFVILNRYDVPSDKLIKLALDVHRQNLLRYSTDRLEIRPSVHANLQDPDIMLSVFLAGSIFGLKSKGRGLEVKAEKVKSPVVHHTKDLVKVTSHLINNSTVGEDGVLQVSEEYIYEHFDTVEYEIGLTDTPPDNTMGSFISRFFGLSDSAPFVIQFLSGIKLITEKNGDLKLVFPETSDGKYKFTLPSVNLDKIPLEMQMRLAMGKELTYEELGDYILPGERVPRIAKEVVIDVDRLKKNIEVQGTKSKYVVKEYDLNKLRMSKKPDSWTDVAWARYKRFINSAPLHKGMTPNFRIKFAKLAKEFAAPEVEKVPKISFSEAREMFIEKILDEDYTIETINKFLLSSYQKHKMTEGVDYLTKYARVKFENIFNPKIFENGLKRLFYDINSESGGDVGNFIISSHAYADGGFSFDVDIDRKMLRKIKSYSRSLK